MIGCKDNGTGPAGGSGPYFPLQVGFNWNYKEIYPDTIQRTVRVTGAMQLNGKVYYSIQNMFPPTFKEHFPEESILIRTDGKNVYTYANGKESCIFRFYAPKDSVWGWWLNDSALFGGVVISDDDTVHTSFGLLKHCVTIELWYNTGGSDWTFCPGIGIVKHADADRVEGEMSLLQTYSF